MKLVKNFECKNWKSRKGFRKEINDLTIEELKELISYHKEEEFNLKGFICIQRSFNELAFDKMFINEEQIRQSTILVIKNIIKTVKHFRAINKREKIIRRNLKSKYRKTKCDNYKEAMEQLNVRLNNDLFKYEKTVSQDYVNNSADAVATMINQSIKRFSENSDVETIKESRDDIFKLFDTVLKTKDEKNYFHALLILTLKSYIKENGYLVYDYVYSFLTITKDEVVLS